MLEYNHSINKIEDFEDFFTAAYTIKETYQVFHRLETKRGFDSLQYAEKAQCHLQF